jgi:hypothetical protein
LLHSFLKKTKTVPEADKDIAAGRWEDFKARMGTPIAVFRRVRWAGMRRDASLVWC